MEGAELVSKRSLRLGKPRAYSESEDFEGKLSDKKKERKTLRKRTPKRSRNPKSGTASNEDRNLPDVGSKLKSEGQEAWTDKYKPSKTHPFIGSASTISELRSWLLGWKAKNVQPARSKPHQPHSDSEDSTECVSNCFLLTGPPGVGKTSSVYYLAEELGFKVLEVHASSERTGRRILSQLQEAAQSHHVEGSKLPLLFQSCNAVVQHEVKSTVQKRTPKLKKVGPLQKLFEQQANSKRQPKNKFPESILKQSSKSTPKGCFVLAAEENLAKADGLKQPSTKATLLDYFGGTTAVAKSKESTTSPVTQGRGKRKLCVKSLKKTRKKTKLPSEEDDVEIIPVEIDGNVAACKSSAVDKAEPIFAKRADAKKNLNNNGSLVAAIRGDTSEKSRIENDHKCTVKKRMKAVPRSPVQKCKKDSDVVLTESDPKSSLTFSSLTIILFDDVDTIFQQDEGFWSAVDSVLSTTKKPVVFTATRDIWLVRAKLPSHCPVAEFFSPSCAEVVKLLKNVCFLEGVQAPSDGQLQFMSQYYHCDVRRCLSELQLQALPTLQASDMSDSKQSGRCSTHLPLREECSRVLWCDKCTDTVEVQLMYKELGLDLVYLSLSDLLPFPIIEHEQKPPRNVNLMKKECQSPFDVSWLNDSDEEGEKGSTVIETECIAKSQHSHAHTLKGCLCELAFLFDDFSMVDYFLASYSRCLGSTTRSLPSSRIDAWQAGRADLLHGDDKTCLSMSAYTASDMLSYFEVSSARLRACRLQGLMADVGEECSEASFVASSYIPSLYNFYDIAASSGSLKRRRQQLAESTAPASVALNSIALSDYMNSLKEICTSEKQRQDWNTKRSQRFLHYLNSCSLFLTEDLVTFLCKGLST